MHALLMAMCDGSGHKGSLTARPPVGLRQRAGGWEIARSGSGSGQREACAADGGPGVQGLPAVGGGGWSTGHGRGPWAFVLFF